MSCGLSSLRRFRKAIRGPPTNLHVRCKNSFRRCLSKTDMWLWLILFRNVLIPFKTGPQQQVHYWYMHCQIWLGKTCGKFEIILQIWITSLFQLCFCFALKYLWHMWHMNLGVQSKLWKSTKRSQYVHCQQYTVKILRVSHLFVYLSLQINIAWL